MAISSVLEGRINGSLRRRLLAIAVLTIVVTLGAASAALIVLFEQHVLKRVVQELEIRSTELAKAFVLDGDGKPSLTHDLADPRYHAPYGGAYWQIAEGDVQHLRSRSLWDEILDTGKVKAEDKQNKAFELEGPEKAELYVLERQVTLEGQEGPRRFQLAVALDHADVNDLRRAFTWDMGLVMALLAALLVGGAWFQMSYGLLPLSDLHAGLTAVREGKTARFVGRLPDEVMPLADDLNALLERQENLVRKARDRASSLAHGLKTPLTILSSEIARLERSGQYGNADILRAQCEAIRAHVERELARARTHGAVQAVSRRTLILPIVTRLVDLMSRIEGAHAIDWRVAIPDDASAAMETDDFAEVVGNLLDNARKWARSIVVVELRLLDGVQHLSIHDDGPGVPGDRREAVLQRGVRFAPDAHDSSGLGLAIVADTLAEYGRELSIADTKTGCAISFPIDPPRAGAPLRQAAVTPGPAPLFQPAGAYPADRH